MPAPTGGSALASRADSPSLSHVAPRSCASLQTAIALWRHEAPGKKRRRNLGGAHPLRLLFPEGCSRPPRQTVRSARPRREQEGGEGRKGGINESALLLRADFSSRGCGNRSGRGGRVCPWARLPLTRVSQQQNAPTRGRNVGGMPFSVFTPALGPQTVPAPDPPSTQGHNHIALPCSPAPRGGGWAWLGVTGPRRAGSPPRVGAASEPLEAGQAPGGPAAAPLPSPPGWQRAGRRGGEGCAARHESKAQEHTSGGSGTDTECGVTHGRSAGRGPRVRQTRHLHNPDKPVAKGGAQGPRPGLGAKAGLGLERAISITSQISSVRRKAGKRRMGLSQRLRRLLEEWIAERMSGSRSILYLNKFGLF